MRQDHKIGLQRMGAALLVAALVTTSAIVGMGGFATPSRPVPAGSSGSLPRRVEVDQPANPRTQAVPVESRSVTIQATVSGQTFTLSARLLLDTADHGATLSVVLPEDGQDTAAAFYVADHYSTLMDDLLDQSRAELPPGMSDAAFQPTGEVILATAAPMDAAEQSVVKRLYQANDLTAAIHCPGQSAGG